MPAKANTPLTAPTPPNNAEILKQMAEALEQVVISVDYLKKNQSEMTSALWAKTTAPLNEIASLFTESEPAHADFWTKSQAMVELFGILEKIIWIAALIDDTFEPSDTSPLGSFSWIGLGVGFGVSFLLTIAEMQCHRIINTINQIDSLRPSAISLSNVKLPWSQRFYLAGEAISHVGEIGGQFAMYTRVFGIANPWVKAGIHILGTAVFGVLGSVAETRTHYRAMLFYQSTFSPEKQTSDECPELDLEVGGIEVPEDRRHRVQY